MFQKFAVVLLASWFLWGCFLDSSDSDAVWFAEDSHANTGVEDASGTGLDTTTEDSITLDTNIPDVPPTCDACPANSFCNDSFECECEVGMLKCGYECCTPFESCDQGSCCTSQCGDAECGNDGCGGSCGVCPADMDCVGGYCEDACIGPGCNPPTGTCERWSLDRVDMSVGVGNARTSSCDPGVLANPGRTNALKLVNLYRFLVGLPAVSLMESKNVKAQACALIMHANDDLSHFPPANWKCYSSDGSEAAGKSNIASTAGVEAIDLYMVDPGNDTTLGHRRWILSNSLGPIGAGSTTEASCLLVLGGSGNAGAPWIAWPPPGDFPYEAAYPEKVWWSSLDETGWSVQSDNIYL